MLTSNTGFAGPESKSPIPSYCEQYQAVNFVNVPLNQVEMVRLVKGHPLIHHLPHCLYCL